MGYASARAIEKTFPEAVRQAFAPLMTQYGFTIQREEEWIIQLNSPDCIILVERDPIGVGVSLKPVRVDQMPKPRPPVPVSRPLHLIMKHLHPSVPFEGGSYRTADELRAAINRLAVVVENFCQPLLQGDFSVWSKI